MAGWDEITAIRVYKDSKWNGTSYVTHGNALLVHQDQELKALTLFLPSNLPVLPPQHLSLPENCKLPVINEHDTAAASSANERSDDARELERH